jgi:hypothetical protein
MWVWAVVYLLHKFKPPCPKHICLLLLLTRHTCILFQPSCPQRTLTVATGHSPRCHCHSVEAAAVVEEEKVEEKEEEKEEKEHERDQGEKALEKEEEGEEEEEALL